MERIRLSRAAVLLATLILIPAFFTHGDTRVSTASKASVTCPRCCCMMAFSRCDDSCKTMKHSPADLFAMERKYGSALRGVHMYKAARQMSAMLDATGIEINMACTRLCAAKMVLDKAHIKIVYHVMCPPPSPAKRASGQR